MSSTICVKLHREVHRRLCKFGAEVMAEGGGKLNDPDLAWTPGGVTLSDLVGLLLDRATAPPPPAAAPPAPKKRAKK